MPWLEWHQRNEDLKATAQTPYRLLQSVKARSYGEADSPNMLIQGDNLEALKALLPYYAGQVKCIFIDPPYNTKSAFEHYDDNLEHAQWLSMMYPRIVLLRELLAEEGSIWITLDDNEAHYFKVMCDEIFGRRNFVASFVWQKTLTRRNDAKVVSVAHDYVIVYSRNQSRFQLKRLAADARQRATYKNPDKDPRGDWLAVPFHAPNIRVNLTYPITTPGGKVLMPPAGRHWSTTEEKFTELMADNRVYFGRNQIGMAQRKKFWSESENTVVPWTWWPYEETGDNREANREAKAIAELANIETVFATPKPEKLLKRILELATDPGDLVLDSFLGSGTTAAVAHKMGRRWIGIEVGEQATTYCQPRLKEVVDGEQGGVSDLVEWQGGGGFQFYKLGPTVFDEHGQIRSDIKFEHLAAHVWFSETGTARSARANKSPMLGVHSGTAYYLLYNGILGDESLSGGNMLTLKVWAGLTEHDGPKVVFGAGTSLSRERLRSLGITFKQTPYDLRTG